MVASSLFLNGSMLCPQITGAAELLGQNLTQSNKQNAWRALSLNRFIFGDYAAFFKANNALSVKQTITIAAYIKKVAQYAKGCSSREYRLISEPQPRAKISPVV
jgi:hypothetical protein